MHAKNWSVDKVIGIFLMSCFCMLCIVPMIAILSISFSDESMLSFQGYRIYPQGFTLSAYQYLISTNGLQILRAYGVTIVTTVVGTFISLLVMSLLAFALARPDFAWRRQISMTVFFTMLFNGGLVPTYMVVTRLLHIQDTIWSLILPYAVSAWNVILMRTFFYSIPIELSEAARIDGASNLQIFFHIYIPLGKAAFATVGIFMALRYWNDWWLPLLYIRNMKLYNLQFMLYKVMANIQMLAELAQMGGISSSVSLADIPNESVRMAICIVVAGPMLFVFPFFQKHFARGLTIGSVKG
ncbi:sugar ABC transporter permease [Spirochaetia bacterium]|nr:sugar ABC transporter permease [Spirochaetia bacterium]